MGAIVLLSLNRLPANELYPPFIKELIQAHQAIAQDEEVKGLILNSCSPKYFCNGMDPEYICAQDQAGRKELFILLSQLLQSLYAFPKPHFALVEGHAMAGGAFLALVSDFRYMADNHSRYCFSEVAVNLTIPSAFLALIREVLHPRYIRKLAMQSYAFRSQEAYEVGLVDFVCPPGKLLERAQKDMRGLLAYPMDSLISIKKNLRSPVLDTMKKYEKEAFLEIEKFLGKNFEASMTALLKRKKA